MVIHHTETATRAAWHPFVAEILLVKCRQSGTRKQKVWVCLRSGGPKKCNLNIKIRNIMDVSSLFFFFFMYYRRIGSGLCTSRCSKSNDSDLKKNQYYILYYIIYILYINNRNPGNFFWHSYQTHTCTLFFNNNLFLHRSQASSYINTVFNVAIISS